MIPIVTQRLTLREVTHDDAAFILKLLNTPKFIKYIGDRGVRSIEDAVRYIDERYLASYRDNGYGLYGVVENASGVLVGACGFVRRDALPAPDIGFSFLPEFERKGYGFESATAVMKYGREVLGFDEVLAITSLDNDASAKLLTKLGFTFDKIIDLNGEPLKLFVNG
ncbi:MAG: GNAT family N-acetyltransferase [Blastocatellia bacterium]|nr:GNAT family N-acetyltransferase [Blastocatellia bacterium]